MNSPLTNKRLGHEMGEELAANTIDLNVGEYVEIMSENAAKISGSYRGHISHRITYDAALAAYESAKRAG
ncbi:MAG: hypothetical protein GY774_16750 [Planctomycetes bacterium]|nr:hypothetical protein [Planctomycetota bacterium]